jgi:hypothetical protein
MADRFHRTPAPAAAAELPPSYRASIVARQLNEHRYRLRGVASGSLRDVKRLVYGAVTGYRAYARPLLREQVAFRIRCYTHHREYEARAAAPEAFDGLRYVFYPLNHEPEGSLTVMAPEFNHQGGIVDLLAKSLPADVRLVIKEHNTAGIAARPPGFYAWLHALPNVLLASMHSHTMGLIRSSLAVAVATGTPGFEAAVLGVPVVSFGRHNVFNPMPHVHVVERISELRPLLERLCSAEHQARAGERRLDGARFLEALKACSVDLEDEEWFTEGARVTETKGAAAADLLLATLQP